MSANISFLAGPNFTIQDLSGSGLGFYGAGGFGASVKVGEWQGRTFITDSTGTTQGAEVGNIAYKNAGSGIIGQAGTGIALTAIPNYQATLNVRFTYDTPVKVQNCRLISYDRVAIQNVPSGVTVMGAEIIHPGITQSNTGSGDTTWTSLAGTGTVINLAPSPGVSGLYAGNGNDGQWTDKEHDWFVALSASPTQIGSRLFGAYVDLEYL